MFYLPPPKKRTEFDFLPQRIRNALLREGIKTIEQAAQLTVKEFLSIPTLGASSLRRLETRLGFKLKGNAYEALCSKYGRKHA